MIISYHNFLQQIECLNLFHKLIWRYIQLRRVWVLELRINWRYGSGLSRRSTSRFCR